MIDYLYESFEFGFACVGAEKHAVIISDRNSPPRTGFGGRDLEKIDSSEASMALTQRSEAANEWEQSPGLALGNLGDGSGGIFWMGDFFFDFRGL